MSADVIDSQVSVDNSEAWFLDAIGQENLPMDQLLNFLSNSYNKAKLDIANKDVYNKEIEFLHEDYICLQQRLITLGDTRGLVELIKLKISWGYTSPRDVSEYKKVLIECTDVNRMESAFINSVDFGNERIQTSIARLENLLGLKVGAYCVEKAWGLGEVKEMDDFHKRLVVDFEYKPNHEMSFSFASKAIKPAGENHILVVRNKDYDEFRKLCEHKAGEVVRMAIESFGPMSVVKLEAELKPILPQEIVWKSFWTQARNQLKNDEFVKLPPTTKKSEPITIVKTVTQVGDNLWLTELANTNDVPALLTKLTEFLGSVKSKMKQGRYMELAGDSKAVIENRLSFMLKASGTIRDNDTKFRTAILAYQLGFDSVPVQMNKSSLGENEFVFIVDDNGNETDNVSPIETIRIPELVLVAAETLPSTILEQVADNLPVDSDIELAKKYIDILTQMPFALFDKLAVKLSTGVAQNEFARVVEEEFSKPRAIFTMLLWFCKNQGSKIVRDMLAPAALATHALISLENQEAGEDLKLQHLVAKCFADEKWLFDIAERMNEYERRAFFEHLVTIEHAWEPAVKRAIIASFTRKYPEFIVKKVDAEDEANSYGRITSWRSFKARQERLRVLKEEEIPQNIKDIEVARGYGDLRENFEYQTAKDRQRILEKQQEDLLQELATVRGFDFAEIKPVAGKVGLATTVTIELLGNGSTLRYTILGEWDSDDALNIIPSRSRLAESLMGKQEGSLISVPNERGEPQQAKLVKVEPISEEILAWTRG
ncbi:MAG: GreA/GreB family elongation factor [Kiritimatiellae bacterium]|nr:GreA/GreB family elongation factor [Kiritimatiellia bacterium]